MKAEEYLTKGTGNFSNCTDYDDAIKAMKEYTRIQIEKYRERVKANAKIEKICPISGLNLGISHKFNVYGSIYRINESSIDSLPINLD